jgi:hypothetical protein
MDIFSDSRQDIKKLEKFKSVPLLFSPFENSTCSVNGWLCGVSFNEEDIIPYMECSGNIVRLDCNFGHKISESHRSKTTEKKSNRGRKKKDKVKKMRKYQGDGSSFNSQITIGILGTHVRRKPFIPDKHSIKATRLGRDLESITKEYKIKVFRNGSITVPGVLTEDMSDIIQPLDEVCDYLSCMLISEIKPMKLFSVMRNYKCRLLKGKIDIQQLQHFCERHFHHLLNTKFSDIVDFLTNPAFEDMELSPLFEGWNEVLSSGSYYSRAMISYQEMRQYLSDSLSIKNLYIDFDKLSEKIKEYPIQDIYDLLCSFYDIVNDNYYKLDNSVYKRILRFLMIPQTNDLNKFLTRSKDNLLSHIKYDPEKYPGFLIKIKTPNSVDQNKKTTIKIFPSGKINIDGANSRSEAEFIYYWLNHVFYTNSELVYCEEFNYDGPDSEFSSDSEDN